jgi:hypothetical protein
MLAELTLSLDSQSVQGGLDEVTMSCALSSTPGLLHHPSLAWPFQQENRAGGSERLRSVSPTRPTDPNTEAPRFEPATPRRG